MEGRATSDGTRIGILEGETKSIISLAEFRARLGADSWIRLHLEDFEQITPTMEFFTHFNLSNTSHVVGLHYVLVPIIRRGSRTLGGEEIPAYVDLSRTRHAVCIAVELHVPFTSVTSRHFEHSLARIRSQHQLRAAMLSRYRSMFPGQSDDAIIDQGCAITSLRFL